MFVFVRLFYFLLSPRSYSCSGKKCALPPSEPLVDHRPRRDMVRRGCNVCGGEGGIVTQPQIVNRLKIFRMVYKELDNQASSGRYKIVYSEAVLEALEAYLESIRRSRYHTVQCGSSPSKPRQTNQELPNSVS